MRKLILISALMLASASAFAGETRSLTLASNDVLAAPSQPTVDRASVSKIAVRLAQAAAPMPPSPTPRRPCRRPRPRRRRPRLRPRSAATPATTTQPRRPPRRPRPPTPSRRKPATKRPVANPTSTRPAASPPSMACTGKLDRALKRFEVPPREAEEIAKFLPLCCRLWAYSVVLKTNGVACHMLYAILCYHDEDTVGSWSKEQDAAVMKKLAVVQDKLAKAGPARAGRAAVADHGRDHAAQGRSAAGARRPLCRDQGAVARLLRRRLQESRRGARGRARPRQGQSRRRLRDPPGRHLNPGSVAT